MDLLVLVASSVAAFLALGLSVVALTLTWTQRASDPRTAHIEGELAELSDRLYSFMKRDAARVRRAKGDPEKTPESGSQGAFSSDPSIQNMFERKYAGR